MKVRKKNFDFDNMSLKDKFLYFFNFFCKSLFYSVCGVIILALLLFVIYYADLVLNVKSGNDTVPLFGSYVIVSESMVPTININDVVIVKRSDKSDIDVGDIITFSSVDKRIEGLTITHRIVGKQNDDKGNIMFRTRGDNNNFDDPSYVQIGSVYGKVVFKVPKLGYIQNIISTPLGSLFSFIIAFTLIIAALFLKPKLVKQS